MNKKNLLAGVFAGMLGFVSTGYSDVIYLNNFGNNTGGTIALNTYDSGTGTGIDWRLWTSQNGAGATNNSSASGNARFGVNATAGRPTNAANVNAPISLSDANGVAFLSNGAGATATFKALFYTDQYAIDRSAWLIDSFQWYANQSTAGGTSQRLALQINGAWYVTTAITPSEGSFNNFSTTATLQTVDFASAQWYSLTAGIGSAFAIGSTVTLPEGDITSFGLYVDNGTVASSYSRFDTFTINGTVIPEPGVFTLVAFGALALLTRRRRH